MENIRAADTTGHPVTTHAPLRGLPPIALPTPLTSFIGREREVSEVSDLLDRDDVRLLTLTGTGGVGKTRLAIAAANKVVDRFPDGVFFVSLAPVAEGRHVVSVISRALGLQETSDQPQTERLAAWLGNRKLLLLLDNFEHLLEAATIAAELPETCSRLTILCTSRTRLNVSGERVYPLASLHPGAAETLFEQRAQALDPSFALTDATAPVVETICHRLDGLPLAIELAAARVTALPPGVLLSRLERRLHALAHGPRDAPRRQQTLREAIAWSHDLLSPISQAALRRLSVFTGGFTFEAAEAVTGTGDETLDILSSLLEHSLLKRAGDPGGDPRYVMLETIREFAMERLVDSGEESEVRHRHAAHFTAETEEMFAVFQVPLLPELERHVDRLYPEHDNLRIALAWLLEHDPLTAARMASNLDHYWYTLGFFDEGRSWLEQTLAKAPTMPAEIRRRVVDAAGWIAHQQGDHGKAESWLLEAQNLHRSRGDLHTAGWTYQRLFHVALMSGSLARARDYLNNAASLASQQDNGPLADAASIDFGRLAIAEGDPAGAIAVLDDAVRRHRGRPGRYPLAFDLYYLGLALLEMDERQRATACHLEALQLFGAARDQSYVARCAEGIACALATERPMEAVRLLSGADAIRTVLGQTADQVKEARWQRALAEARPRLPEAVSAEAWGAGQALSWERLYAKAEAAATAFIEDRPDSHASNDHDFGLTPREVDVLELLIEGRSDREIAEALFISPKTVGTHMTHILDKLGVPSRAAAVAYAHRHGLA